MGNIDDKDDPAEVGVSIFPKADWLLQDFVRVTNKFDLQMGITITVGGNLFSGQLVSSAHYFSLMKEAFATAGGEASVSENFSDAMAAYEKGCRDNMSEDIPGQPVFIHLKDVKVYGPNAVRSAQLTQQLWRGRLTDVSGFMFGSIAFRDS